MSVYLDYNATTPLAAEVVADISSSLSAHWANPSSSHGPGVAARAVVEQARSEVAATIGARPEQIVFTSGGTEANNMVLSGCVAFYRSSGRTGRAHVITSDTEHDSVAEPLRHMERHGLCSVTRLSCAEGGRVSPDVLLRAVTTDTCLVSVMHANNETGVLNDIETIGRLLAGLSGRHQLWFHTDSAQTVGKVKVDVTRLGVDFFTVVGHKLYGPRVGALYISPLGAASGPDGESCVTLLRGGGQERRLRPGTENTPLIRGLGTACRLVTQNSGDRDSMTRLRDSLETQLLKTGVAERINLSSSARLPNTTSAVLAGRWSGRAVLARCRRLLASTGSACHQQTDTPSAVLLRSGVSADDAVRTVRLSVGRYTTDEDVSAAVADLQQALKELENGEHE